MRVETSKARQMFQTNEIKIKKKCSKKWDKNDKEIITKTKVHVGTEPTNERKERIGSEWNQLVAIMETE